MRARLPDTDGYVEHEGVKIGYEVYGHGAPTVLLLPTWTIIHSRFWKLQIPFLARHHRVVAFDGPGNGRSARPVDPAPYRIDAVAGAATAVMDATGTDAAVLVALSMGVHWSLDLAANHPGRVLGQVLIGPAVSLTAPAPDAPRAVIDFHRRFDDPQGWQRYNAHHWREHYEDFAEFFFSQAFSEPHSTKQREDTVGWALETTPEVLIADAAANDNAKAADTVRALCARIDAPTLVIHGGDDRVRAVQDGRLLADALDGEFVLLEGSGHIPLARDPVKINRLIAAFVGRVAP